VASSYQGIFIAEQSDFPWPDISVCGSVAECRRPLHCPADRTFHL